MFISKKTVVFLLLVIVLFIAGYESRNKIAGLVKITRQGNSVVSPATPPEQSASLTIKGRTETLEYDVSSYINKTVLEATSQVVSKDIETSGEGQNAFVTAIKGDKVDSKKNEFWELDINGTPAEVGAGSYLIQPKDKIEWRINTY